MKTATTLALALALTAASAPLTAPPALAETRAAAGASDTPPSMSMREFRQWQRNWDRRLREMFETDPETYAWGKEKRPIKAYTVVLDPPLERVGPADKVTVEFFFTPIDERSGRFTSSVASVTVGRCCFSQSVVGPSQKMAALLRRRISWDDGAMREPPPRRVGRDWLL